MVYGSKTGVRTILDIIGCVFLGIIILWVVLLVILAQIPVWRWRQYQAGRVKSTHCPECHYDMLAGWWCGHSMPEVELLEPHTQCWAHRHNIMHF